MFYILPYQNDPEARQAAQGTGTDNPIEGSSTTPQVTTVIPATLSFIIKPIQVQQNNIELCKGNETTEEVVKVPEEIVKTINSPSTSSLPTKKPDVKESTNKIDIKGCRCGMCWETFPTCDQLEAHKCSKAATTCICTLCLAAKKARSPPKKKYKRCSMCSTYYKCVHYLKKHVDRYHGSCICRVCKTKFKTRLLCCKHRCRGPRKGSKKSSKKDSDSDSNTVSDSGSDSHSDSDSDANDEQSEDIEVDTTNTSTNEVLPENDIEIEYIIESERPDSPPITFTSIQRKEDYLKVSKGLDKSSQITLETPVLIDIQNSAFLANEMNIKEGLVEDNPKQQKDVQNLNMNLVQMENQDIEIVAIEGSRNENNFKSENINESELLNMRHDEIQQNIKDKTASFTMQVSVNIETVESDMDTNEGIETNPNDTDLAIIKSTGNVATKTNNLITCADSKTETHSVMIPDSDDESITSETELDPNERNNDTVEIFDSEFSESTDDSKDDEIYRKRKINSNKSRSNVAKYESKKTKVIQCCICSQVFYDKWILNYHIEEEHGAGTDDTDKAKPIQPKITKESYLDFKDF